MADELDWLGIGRTVCAHLRIPAAVWDDAVQEAAIAAWIASARYQPGAVSYRTFVWSAAKHGCIDWIRNQLGRTGRRAAWEASLVRLDKPVTEDDRNTIGDIESPTVEVYEQVERCVDLDALAVRAHLTPHEAQWLRNFLADNDQKPLMHEWGVSEARVSQIKHGTIRKMRAAA